MKRFFRASWIIILEIIQFPICVLAYLCILLYVICIAIPNGRMRVSDIPEIIIETAKETWDAKLKWIMTGELD